MRRAELKNTHLHPIGSCILALLLLLVPACEAKDAPAPAATTKAVAAEQAQPETSDAEPGAAPADAPHAAMPSHGEAGEAVTHAIATLAATSGNSVTGTVRFEAAADGVQITADLEGLTPGDHGFHIHQYGDCSAGDGTSAGGHFNPAGVDHGAPDGAMRHTGDLGNITADEAGKAHYTRADSTVSFAGASSILGRGLIVHEKADDLTSQPTGAAGPRVACGVIGVAKP